MVELGQRNLKLGASKMIPAVMAILKPRIQNVVSRGLLPTRSGCTKARALAP